jgi:hypothetical protein
MKIVNETITTLEKLGKKKLTMEKQIGERRRFCTSIWTKSGMMGKVFVRSRSTLFFEPSL